MLMSSFIIIIFLSSFPSLVCAGYIYPGAVFFWVTVFTFRFYYKTAPGPSMLTKNVVEQASFYFSLRLLCCLVSNL